MKMSNINVPFSPSVTDELNNLSFSREIITDYTIERCVNSDLPPRTASKAMDFKGKAAHWIYNRFN